jgi:heat shock protein HslJ
MIRYHALAAVTAMILVVGCGTPSPVDISGAWQLTGGTVDGAPFPLVADAPVTLSVRGTSITGRSPCNHYGGEIVVDGGGSRFELTEMTAMACEERVMAAEAVFVAALPRVRGATRDGDRLALTGPGVELSFEHLAPPPVAAMVGTNWVLESLLSTDVVVSVAGDPATLRFDAGGTFTGGTGCRTFSGRWVSADGGIATPELAMDQTECAPELAQQDGHIVSVLERFRPSVDGQTLTLDGDSGQGLVYQGVRPNQ